MENITIAVSKYGKPAEMDPRFRMLIMANSGAGKSCLIFNIIEKMVALLRSNMELWVVDGKRGAGTDPLSPRADRFITEPTDYLQCFQDFNTLIDQRFIALKNMGKTCMTDEDLYKYPLILFCVDEFNSVVGATEITKTARTELQNIITQITSRARVCNCAILFCGHQFSASAEGLNSISRQQFNYKAIMRTSEIQTVGMLVPEAETAPAWLISQPGQFYFIENNEMPVLCKTWYTPEQDFKEIMIKYAVDKREKSDLWVVEKQ